MSDRLPYRPEIDGLRMIAVLSVVLYHFGADWLSGGFVGVDVFFVISGFLIGGILWREQAATGRISLARFYVRRIKRLAPAYFAMLFAVSVAAWVIFLPFEFREFGKSVIAATVYLSNILFFRGEGYFDIGAENKALLHTWSLSVEEQFYVVLPLLIILLGRWRSGLTGLLALCFVLSLCSSLYFTQHAPTAAFYLFPFRAWELLSGVLLAIYMSEKPEAKHPSWLGPVGLALICFSLIWIDAARGFPGWQVVLPVLGTAMMLANTSPQSAVNRVLSRPIPVFFGKISYSLYLWHWPVFVLSHYWRDGYANGYEPFAWAFLSIVLATLSWRYVETPIREMRGLSLMKTLGVLSLPTALAVGFGAFIYLKDGVAQRFDGATHLQIRASADFLQDFSRCHSPVSGAFQGVELCPLGPDGPPKVLIWGDSHTRAFKEGLEQAAWDAKTPALLIWQAGCPPLLGITKAESAATKEEDAACTDWKARLERALPTLSSVQSVLLIGRWSYYASGAGSGLDAHNQIKLEDGTMRSNAAILADGFNRTLPWLEAQFGQTFVLRQMPEFPEYDSRRAARLLAHGRTTPQEVRQSMQVPRAKAEARDVQTGANQLDLWSAVCTGNTCSALQDGESWYFDNNHITNTAARALAHYFESVFSGRAR